MEQNRDADINPHRYNHLIFDKGAQNIVGEKTAPSTCGAGKSGYPHVED
jgi:hypothetical protein